MKKCPSCAEEIQDEAIKCRYCGEILDKKTKRKSSWVWWLLGGFIFLYIVNSNSDSNQNMNVITVSPKAVSYYVPPSDKYPLSALFAQDYIDMMIGKTKPGDSGFDRVIREGKGRVSSQDWRMMGSCYAKFLNNGKSDFPPAGCNETELERILTAQDYKAVNKSPIHISPDASERIGGFIPQRNELVSLNGLRVLSSPKPGFYFVITLGGGAQEKPKILIYRSGNLPEGYEFASHDIATYVGRMEYRMWDTDSIELLDVYSLD